MSFSPEISQAMANGTAELMTSRLGDFHAIAVSSNGHRIIEQGVLTRAAPIGPGLIWQLAAVATGQRFLADINKNLNRLNDAIDCLKRIAEAEQIGAVLASFDRLQEIIQALRQGDWSLDDAKRWIGVLDQLDFECARILKAGLTRSGDYAAKAGETHLGTFKVNQDNVKRMVENTTDFDRNFEIWSSALCVRATIMQVRGMLPIGQSELPTRSAACATDIEALRQANESYREAVKKRASGLKNGTFFSSESTESAARNKLVSSADAAFGHNRSRLKTAERLLTSVDRGLRLQKEASGREVKLEVELGGGGSIVAVRRFLAPGESNGDVSRRASTANSTMFTTLNLSSAPEDFTDFAT